MFVEGRSVVKVEQKRQPAKGNWSDKKVTSDLAPLSINLIRQAFKNNFKTQLSCKVTSTLNQLQQLAPHMPNAVLTEWGPSAHLPTVDTDFLNLVIGLGLRKVRDLYQSLLRFRNHIHSRQQYYI